MLFFKYRPCHFLAVLFGLLLPGVVAVLTAMAIGGPPYLFAIFVILFYALPFSLTSLIIYLILLVRKKTQK